MVYAAAISPAVPAIPAPSEVQSTRRNTKQQLSLTHTNQSTDPTVAWTSSIALRCRNGQLREAASEFTRMREADVEPNHVTFITLLSACADYPSDSISFGASIHAYTRKLGLDMNNVMVGTAVIDMYAKCGRVDLARLLFDQLGGKNMVSCNTMINGYMRSGEIENAIELFDKMPVKNAISWTALIGGFVKRDYHEEALECFREMQLAGVVPDYVTIITVLAACANLGTLSLGLWVNKLVMKENLRDNVRVCNSLIDMYSRCGCIEFARQVFEKMPQRTRKGFKPDGVSYTGALTACSHAGLIDKGLQIFNDMKRVHRITPRIEHYGCIVDLYSRAGRLEEALEVIKNMPMKPNEVVLGSLLAACRTQGDVNLAEKVMNYLVELDPDGDSNYVLLANIYAAIGKWDGASKVRRTMKARGIKKKPGFSSVEIDSSIHKFVAGDKSHEEMDSILPVLELLSFELKQCGYISEFTTQESYEDD
ncbi:hypothetical protein K1719_021346 [Acacia pycnantha]|nr:hypothetical protein K1719_021346 [Acacia pycnantha]